MIRKKRSFFEAIFLVDIREHKRRGFVLDRSLFLPPQLGNRYLDGCVLHFGRRLGVFVSLYRIGRYHKVKIDLVGRKSFINNGDSYIWFV